MKPRLPMLVTLGLILVTLLVYFGVHGQAFVNYDDPGYVSRNPNIRFGLTWRGLAYAFGFAEANWHPLTWLSHMLDCQILGVEAGRHKLVNVLLHAANAALLFTLLRKMTGSLWRSAFVAALFALHPLNVESVAWVSERKNVLSTLLGLVALLSYVGYARQPRPWRYGLTLLCFALSLMAKPMLVTLPFVMLLLDCWPLRRWGGDGEELSWRRDGRLIAEKLPFFALTTASCVVTMMASREFDAMWLNERLSLTDRIGNATVGYVLYLGKAIWPASLACIYPATTYSTWQMGLALLALAGITTTAVMMSKRSPGVLIGWLWFLGTLVPVSGLVQTGVLSMADRYAYVPTIGLFIAVVFALPVVRFRPAIAAPAGVALLLALSVCTWRQVGHWRDTHTLFTHALACTERNFVAHTVLGTQLSNRRRSDAAAGHLREALRIEPRYPGANANYGFLLLQRGQHDAALAHFRKAVEIQPSLAPAHLGIATALDAAGQWPEARLRFRRAIELRPGHARFRAAYAAALLRQSETDAALHELRIAADSEPDQPRVHYLLGKAYESLGQRPDAIEAYKLSAKLDPYSSTAWDAMRRCKAELARAAITSGRQASADPASGPPR